MEGLCRDLLERTNLRMAGGVLDGADPAQTSLQVPGMICGRRFHPLGLFRKSSCQLILKSS